MDFSEYTKDHTYIFEACIPFFMLFSAFVYCMIKNTKNSQ